MASTYIIVCNYGTHDGNEGQINNKVLTHDKNFYDYEKLCQRLHKKGCALRNSIVNSHCNNIFLKKLAANFNKI